MAERKKPLEESENKKAGKMEYKFSKEQLLSSKHFQSRKDLVEALLDEKESYTIKAVEEKIQIYMKGKVK